MSDNKRFYKMRHAVDEEGIVILTTKVASIYESPCWHWCIDERSLGYVKTIAERSGESMLRAAKQDKAKIYKVAKDGSRVAFETPQEAFDHLIFLKRKQINHMKRELEVLNDLVDKSDGLKIEAIPCGVYGQRVVPNTLEVIQSNYLFDR